MEDAEDIAVEARLVDAQHIRVSLAKIAGKNKHVSDALQVTEILRSPADSGEVEMIDMTHLVGREGYLLVAIGGQFYEIVGGRYGAGGERYPMERTRMNGRDDWEDDDDERTPQMGERRRRLSNGRYA